MKWSLDMMLTLHMTVRIKKCKQWNCCCLSNKLRNIFMYVTFVQSQRRGGPKINYERVKDCCTIKLTLKCFLVFVEFLAEKCYKNYSKLVPSVIYSEKSGGHP